MKKIKTKFRKLKQSFKTWRIKQKDNEIIKRLSVFLVGLVKFTTHILYWALWVAVLIVPYWIIIYPLIHLIVIIVVKLNHMRFLKEAKANTIIYGGRGSGKGLLFQFVINTEKKALTNIPYGKNTEVVNPKEYFGSIQPNTALKFLNENVDVVKKRKEWEKVPYFADDSTLFFPNYLDYELKKLYPQISLFLPIQRHLYDSYTIFNAQSIDRIFIQVRELQMDGFIKALKTNGKGKIWQSIPILKKYMRVKYRFYENKETAVQGLLPYSKLGITQQATGMLYTTTAGATKEEYEARNGKIRESAIWIKRKHIYYDTRYYHSVFFGEKP